MSAPTQWTMTIPAPAPWLNANSRRDRRGANGVAALTREWRNTAHLIARRDRLPVGVGPVDIDAVLRFTDRRTRDGHNYYPTVKAAIDGLVDHGVMSDDDWSNLGTVAITIGDPIKRRPYGPVGELVLTIREVAGG